MSVTPGDVMQVLKDIETGEITLSILNPDAIHHGWDNIEYRASNGWTLVIFECDYSWGYLDSIVLPDGTRVNLEDDRIKNNSEWDNVRQYSPSVETSREIYNLPEESLEERTIRLEMEMEKEYQDYLNSQRTLRGKESEED